jgi:putative ABC transport system substrate-binding protein
VGRQIRTHTARNDSEIEAVFTTLAKLHAGALLIMGDSFFTGRSRELGETRARHAIPAAYVTREFTLAGGLMNYGASDTDAFRTLGVYAGRILKGEKAAELPVLQSTKIELVLNLKTARTLGLSVPQSILLRADEVIE